MMTTDNADGGAVPPTTHYAIKQCCLICADAAIDTDEDSAICVECLNHDADEFMMPSVDAFHACDYFTLRDFGYPVRKVDVE